MSFTKVAPAGIGTTPGDGITIGDTFLHTTGIDIGHTTGVGVTIRQHGDATFTGVITAHKFVGDISDATGQASGLGTALSQTQTDVLNKVYYTNSILEISSNTTIDTPSSAAGGYTNYAEIKVTDGNTLSISSGDEFKLNVLGIGTLSNY
tara:strand:- start:294 stop:743 length:450 start_codon:yes stop_codon:yes gene_type:complete